MWCLTELVFSWIPSRLQVKPLQSARCWSCCRSQPPDIVAIRVTPETLIAKNSSKLSHHQSNKHLVVTDPHIIKCTPVNTILWGKLHHLEWTTATSEAATPSKHFTVHSHSKRTRSVQSWWTVKDFRSQCSNKETREAQRHGDCCLTCEPVGIGVPY